MDTLLVCNSFETRMFLIIHPTFSSTRCLELRNLIPSNGPALLCPRPVLTRCCSGMSSPWRNSSTQMTDGTKRRGRTCRPSFSRSRNRCNDPSRGKTESSDEPKRSIQEVNVIKSVDFTEVTVLRSFRHGLQIVCPTN